MSTLYELSTAYRQVLELAEEETTDIAVIADTLDSIKGEIEEKAVSIVGIVRSMAGDIDLIKAEEKRLASRRKALEGKVKSINSYLLEQMQNAGLDKVKTATLTIKIQNNPPAVDIENPDIIPAKYLTVIPQQYVPDKKMIAEDLKAGKKVLGAKLTQGKRLSIK